MSGYNYDCDTVGSLCQAYSPFMEDSNYFSKVQDFFYKGNLIAIERHAIELEKKNFCYETYEISIYLKSMLFIIVNISIFVTVKAVLCICKMKECFLHDSMLFYQRFICILNLSLSGFYLKFICFLTAFNLQFI